jgi:hypothetical protein
MAKSASKRGEHNQEERMVEVAFWIVPATGRAHLQVFCEQTDNLWKFILNHIKMSMTFYPGINKYKKYLLLRFY